MYCARGGAGMSVAVAVGRGVDVAGIIVAVDEMLVDVGIGFGGEHEAMNNKSNRRMKMN